MKYGSALQFTLFSEKEDVGIVDEAGDLIQSFCAFWIKIVTRTPQTSFES